MYTHTKTPNASTPKNSTPKNTVSKKITPRQSISKNSTLNQVIPQNTISKKATPKSTSKKNSFPISASTISGFKVTLRAALQILSELHHNYGYDYLITSRLTQDNLERLFSIMRYSCGANDHPTPQQFGQVFRLYCCNTMIKPPKGSNVTGVELLQTLMKTEDSLKMSRQPRMEWLEKIDKMLERAVPIGDIWNDNSSNDANESSVSSIDLNASESLTTEPTSRIQTTLESLEHHDYDVVSTSREVQAYMAGYIVRKMKYKCKCSSCFYTLQSSNDEPNCRDRFIDLMEKYGGLSRASDNLFQLTMQLEAAFLDVVGRVGLSRGTINKILDRIESMLPQLSFVGCGIHQLEITKDIIDFYITMRLYFLGKTFNKRNQLKREKMKT
ncbi:GSCOCG00008236001-RA-CDS [Cotesia congregata]|nr:GSCOCG00008236001-RA-CDS [Cotesia congregata]